MMPYMLLNPPTQLIVLHLTHEFFNFTASPSLLVHETVSSWSETRFPRNTTWTNPLGLLWGTTSNSWGPPKCTPVDRGEEDGKTGKNGNFRMSIKEALRLCTKIGLLWIKGAASSCVGENFCKPQHCHSAWNLCSVRSPSCSLAGKDLEYHWE